MHKNVRTIDTSGIEFYEIRLALWPSNPYCTITVVDGGSGEVHSDSEMV